MVNDTYYAKRNAVKPEKLHCPYRSGKRAFGMLLRMPKRALGKHYIKEWRTHRGLSLQKLSERLEFEPGETFLTAASLSRIENGIQAYTQQTLEALADALQVDTWDLLHNHPEHDADIIDLWHLLDEQERRQALNILKALKKTG